MGDAVKPALHGRDHCPGGTDPIPCLGGSVFRALHYNDDVGDDITVGGATNVDITYNYWNDADYNPSIFRPETSLGGTPTLGTHNVQRVELLASGFYIISWGLNWSSPHTGLTQMSIHDDDVTFGRPDTVVHGGNGAFNTSGYLVQTMARYYLLLDPFDSGSWIPGIQTDAAQTSGSSKVVNEAWLEITYFAANG